MTILLRHSAVDRRRSCVLFAAMASGFGRPAPNGGRPAARWRKVGRSHRGRQNMCIHHDKQIDRRRLFALAGLGLAVAGLGFSTAPVWAAGGEKTKLTSGPGARGPEGRQRALHVEPAGVRHGPGQAPHQPGRPPGAVGGHRRLLRQPRSAGAAVRRPGTRRAVRRPQRRQHGGHRHHGHRGVRRRALWARRSSWCWGTRSAARSSPPATSPPRTPSFQARSGRW